HAGCPQKQMTNHPRCDNKLKLGTHVVEDLPWQGNMACFRKAKPGRLPATASHLWRTHNLFMTCTVCGKPHPCAHSGRNTAALSEPRTSVDAAARSKVSNALCATEVLARVERERWRREVVSRVQQHRARRGRFDPNASLDLEFPPEGATALDATATPDQAPALPLDQDAGNAALGDGMGRSLARSRPLKIIRFPGQ